ncbi:serine/threonine-protein kinase [Streptomyces sp. NPDC001027]|uniref:serine/threonine-protein kinase n=1 Tax=Streptomyces sp. NPDC001027 TaxID=3154771 RepID=UPI00332CEDDF
MGLHKDDPKALGGYRIVDRLGAGGMGVVYRGRARSGREVAVKVVHAQYAEDPVFRARFRQEIAVVRKVSGAFTAPVVDADPEAVRPWMATQYVSGPALSARIRDHGPLRGAELRRLALGLVEALREIHRAGVVHRDLKPGNVLMAHDGPRVIDFGISRAAENQTLTETGKMIGTPPFMSPEQLTDARSVGPASDVFSLAALLVFAATGRGPFDADSPYLTAWRVMQEEPKVEAVAEPLRSVLTRCLAKDADSRPGLEELAEEFARVLPGPAAGDQETVSLRLPPPATEDEPGCPAGAAANPRPGRRSLLRRWPVLAGTAGVLALAVTGYLLLDVTPFSRAEESSDSSDDALSVDRDPLPSGWRPWQTSVYGVAATGVKKPLGGGAPDNASLTCAMGKSALYCGGDGTLPVRVDGATGRIAWRAESLPRGLSQVRFNSGVLGVHDGVLLVSEVVMNKAGNDQSATLLALDAATGKLLWSRPMPGTGAVDPAVVGDLVLTSDGYRVTARDVRGGAARWTATVPAGPTYHCEFQQADGVPYADCTDAGTPSRNVFYAVDPADGSTRKVSVPDGDLDYVGAVDGDLAFTAQVPRGQRTFDEPAYGEVLLIDPGTGAVRKVKLTGSPRGQVALVGGVLCFADSRGRLAAHSPGTGKQLWQTSTTLQQPGRPAADGRGQTVFAASASGRVAAVDVATGELLWESAARAERVVDSGYAAPRVFFDGGALVVLSPDGTVFTVDPEYPDLEPQAG